MTASTEAEPGPGETREDIPLKVGTKIHKWYSCNEDCLSGSRFINIAFGTLTFVITVALLVQIYYGDYQVVPHGSVATDSVVCSKIGTSILKQRGNAVDAAIASAFCLAVVTPHVTGLDAEGQFLIYHHKNRKTPIVIDFSSPNVVSQKLPRLVLGLAYTHKKFGKLAWQKLVEPSAELAKRGFLVSKMLDQAIKSANVENLYEQVEQGQILIADHLSQTLFKIAEMPEDELYSYIETTHQPVRSEALRSNFKDYDVFVPNSPFIGPVLLENLKAIESFNFTKTDTAKSGYITTMAETTLHVFRNLNVSLRFHEGTSSNVAVMDMDDSYVSFISGMYKLFGSGEMSEDGYVHDVKDRDKPCSRIPLIITDKQFICGRRIVFGSNDMVIASQLIASLLIAEQDSAKSTEAPRFHIVSNGSIAIEDSFSSIFTEDTIRYFKYLTYLQRVPEPYPSSNIVEKLKDELSSHSDSRGGGIGSRF